MNILQIMEVNKKIVSIATDDGGTYSIEGATEEINPYYENGEMAHVLWFCCNLKNGTEVRVNAKYVSYIEFEKESR
jgi:hypothetical protein